VSVPTWEGRSHRLYHSLDSWSQDPLALAGLDTDTNADWPSHPHVRRLADRRGKKSGQLLAPPNRELASSDTSMVLACCADDDPIVRAAPPDLGPLDVFADCRGTDRPPVLMPYRRLGPASEP
jgi:hypothetical protein